MQGFSNNQKYRRAFFIHPLPICLFLFQNQTGNAWTKDYEGMIKDILEPAYKKLGNFLEKDVFKKAKS